MRSTITAEAHQNHREGAIQSHKIGGFSPDTEASLYVQFVTAPGTDHPAVLLKFGPKTKPQKERTRLAKSTSKFSARWVIQQSPPSKEAARRQQTQCELNRRNAERLRNWYNLDATIHRLLDSPAMRRIRSYACVFMVLSTAAVTGYAALKRDHESTDRQNEFDHTLHSIVRPSQPSPRSERPSLINSEAWLPNLEQSSLTMISRAQAHIQSF